MAKSSVLKRLLPDAKLPRNAFDRSCVINQSTDAGKLCLFYAQPFTKGSHVKLNRRVFTRTAQVNTAAFTIIDQHVEYFAVPISYLWSYWDNYKLMITDYNSSLLNISAGGANTNPSSVPYFDIDAFLNLDLGTWSSALQVDDLGYNWGNGALRIMEACGMPIMAKSPSTSPHAFAQNLFKACAYQKVYMDHFRNSMFEANNNYAYNLDWLTADASYNNKIDFTDSLYCVPRFYQIFKQRYVDYRKDYFKNIYPSLNYSSNMSSYTNSYDIPGSVVYQFSSQRPDSIITNSGGMVSLGNVSTGTPATVYNSVQAIRAAFALDKLMRHIAYAPKHVKQQIEARYGVKASNRMSYESERIAAFKNDIVIGEVTSMANTASGGSGDALGAIGGKGIGSSNFQTDVEYTCNEDCIIIGVTYFLPRISYDAKGADNWNCKLLPQDFFVPEYMDLGLQPVYRYEMSRIATINDNVVFGYAPRYQEYKLGIDKNFGPFKNLVSQFNISGSNITHGTTNGALKAFVVHGDNQVNWTVGTSATMQYFKVDPKILDSIFVQSMASSNLPNDAQFYFNIVDKCVSNQNMSVHGQPSF